jgi:hypothetical protein
MADYRGWIDAYIATADASGTSWYFLITLPRRIRRLVPPYQVITAKEL